jgi:uncharacterized protein (TIGR03437 family)
MNRRSFFRIGAATAVALPQLPDRLFADQDAHNDLRRAVSPIDRAPDLVRKALSSKITGFPTVEPIFGGSFLPGGNQTQLISANGFASLNTQVQTLAASGWRLASLTAIRNMNATWYYAALEQGSGSYMLLRTSDPNVFQQTFTANQTGYRLVDFAVTWEQSELYYTGYWLAVSSPVNQILALDLDYADFSTQWTTLSTEGMRMTRIQPSPQLDIRAYSTLYEPGTDGYVLYFDTPSQFPIDTTGKWAGISLVGLGYDTVNGQVAGCWRSSIKPYQFVWNQDWNTLQVTAQKMAANGLILRAVSAYPSAPDWDDYFATYLAPLVVGYSYAVGQSGQVVAKGYGFARGPHETQNPNLVFTADTRINLASVSKVITGIALEVLIQKYPAITLDTPFWPLIASMVPYPDPSVKAVTLRNLANMTSGMLLPPGNEGPASGDLWPYLNTYLLQPLVGTPGVTYEYSNTNYTILQGVIDQVTGQDYVTWVTQNVLVPAGINTSVLNATPDPQATATLCYSGPNDPLPGQYWSTLSFVAPSGWISTATEILKVLFALRSTSVLPASTISEMLNDGIGAWVPVAGNYGTYYQKGGDLINGLTPQQALETCVYRFTECYDVALVANTVLQGNDILTICAGAFDSRGLLTTDLPPAITTIIGAATLLPKAAPAAYCSIMGSGFTDQAATDWSSSITGSALPTSVGGISVNVNGAPAYVEYVSATQVNFLLPASAAVATANVDLITPIGVMSATLEIDSVAPGLFCYTLHGVLYPASVFATGSGVVYVAAAGALPGYTSRPAVAGDLIELYATGCGLTNPVAPDGVVLTKAYPAADLASFQVTIAGKAASVLFAGLIGPGLWQVNVQIPSGLIGGDQPLVLSVNGAVSQPNVMLTVQGG